MNYRLSIKAKMVIDDLPRFRAALTQRDRRSRTGTSEVDGAAAPGVRSGAAAAASGIDGWLSGRRSDTEEGI